jgi:hypothetical protein
MPIFYVYDKVTGEFAGSGTPQIEDDKYASTTVAPSADLVEPPRPKLKFDKAMNRWHLLQAI